MSVTTFNVKNEVLAAEDRIRPHINTTPLELSQPLSEMAGCQVYLKEEHSQLTGSFKVRGALNKLMSLSDEQRAKGVVVASTGNHGLAVTHGLKTLGVEGLVYLPETTPANKVELLRSKGVPLKPYGTDPLETELQARRDAESQGKTYISPYNDQKIIGGQGTIGVELLQQLPEMDEVYITVGGGGLISGISGYIKETNPDIKIIGCLPKNSPVMVECIRAGEIIDVPMSPTLSDATAGGLEANAITFGICQTYVDEWLVVSEAEIQSAMKLIYDHHGWVVEGAAGVPLASLTKSGRSFDQDTKVALVLCGGNVDQKKFQQLVR